MDTQIQVPLPRREGPLNGTFAFSPLGERQIYENVIGGTSKYKIAAECNVSLVTINAIVKRVQARIDAGDEPKAYDLEFYKERVSW